ISAVARRRKSSSRKKGGRRARRRSLPRVLKAATWRRWLRMFRRIPVTVRIVAGCVLIVAVWFAVNGVYQVARKPTELFFPVAGTLYKTPTGTWRTYAPLFRLHSTDIMTPDLLA